jgi:hypothetical protein
MLSQHPALGTSYPSSRTAVTLLVVVALAIGGQCAHLCRSLSRLVAFCPWERSGVTDQSPAFVCHAPGAAAGAGNGGPVVYSAKGAGEFVIAVSLCPVGGARSAELVAGLVTLRAGPAFVGSPGQGII